MKKSLLALAVFGAFATTASAQVTVYGALDANYGSFKTETNDGAGGVTETTNRGLFDGDAVTAPSRWGIKVSSDLGNGLKGIAHLESAVDITDGSTNDNLFHRRAVVGLGGGFGTVLLGRMNAPIHGVLDDTGPFGAAGFDTSIDAFGTGIDDAAGDEIEVGYGAGPGGIRRTNSINYISPDFGGLSAQVQLFSEKDEDAGSESKGFGAAAAYENGPFMVAAGYDRFEGDATDPEQTSWLVGGTYDLGMAKLFAQFGNYEREQATVVDMEAQQFNIGAKVPMGAFTFLASVGRTQGEIGVAEFEGTNYVLGANYNLAKTTYIYARAGQVGNWEADVGTAETKTTGFAVGLRHAF